MGIRKELMEKERIKTVREGLVLGRVKERGRDGG